MPKFETEISRIGRGGAAHFTATVYAKRKGWTHKPCTRNYIEPFKFRYKPKSAKTKSNPYALWEAYAKLFIGFYHIPSNSRIEGFATCSKYALIFYCKHVAR
jgi:hypothetical protein